MDYLLHMSNRNGRSTSRNSQTVFFKGLFQDAENMIELNDNMNDVVSSLDHFGDEVAATRRNEERFNSLQDLDVSMDTSNLNDLSATSLSFQLKTDTFDCDDQSDPFFNENENIDPNSDNNSSNNINIATLSENNLKVKKSDLNSLLKGKDNITTEDLPVSVSNRPDYDCDESDHDEESTIIYTMFSRVRHRRLEYVLKALEDGFDASTRDRNGNTLLHVCAQNNHR